MWRKFRRCGKADACRLHRLSATKSGFFASLGMTAWAKKVDRMQGRVRLYTRERMFSFAPSLFLLCASSCLWRRLELRSDTTPGAGCFVVRVAPDAERAYEESFCRA
jgi:hypothetical protein